MTFGIATILELTLIAAATLLLLAYIPPLGLLVPSTYVSARTVKRALRQGHSNLLSLAKVGAAWGVATMLTIGLAAVCIMIANRIDTANVDVNAELRSWVLAILIGFVVFYGCTAAAIGGLIGVCSWAYVNPRGRNLT